MMRVVTELTSVCVFVWERVCVCYRHLSGTEGYVVYEVLRIQNKNYLKKTLDEKRESV